MMVTVALAVAGSVAVADQPAQVKAVAQRVRASSHPLAGEPGASVETGFGVRGPGSPSCGAVANCQPLNDAATLVGSRTSDMTNLTELGFNDAFITTDNATIAAAGSITSICFWGQYAQTAGCVTPGTPAAGNESFRITYYTNNGAGLPGAVIAQYFVGANSRGVVEPLSTLSRGAPITGVVEGYVWTATHPAVPVAAGQCIWIEVAGATNNLSACNRWGWRNANTASANEDDLLIQYAGSTTPSYIDYVASFDSAWCIDVATTTQACGVPAVPPNGTCDTATAVSSLPFTTSVQTFRAPLNTTVPFCDTNLVYSPAVWYSVTGDGTTLTAQTCGAATDFDTVLNVYCNTCTSLFCVGGNDSAPVSCTGGTGSDPSQFSWPTVNGTTYFVVVYGFQGAVGTADFSITSDGVAATAPACVSDRCDVTLPALLETEACGGFATGTACTDLAGMFSLGVAFGGTSSTTPAGNQRDFDYWELSGAVPDNTGGSGASWLDVTFETEFPVIFNFFEGVCPANTFLGGVLSNYKPCGPKVAQVSTTTGGTFRLNFTQTDFGGNDCQPIGNEYAITVTVSLTGACCVPATACFVTVSGDCATQTGVYQGDGSVCVPTDPCAPPVQGACCRGSTCALDTLAGCVGINTSYRGDASVCGVGNTFAGCCKADFNQSGTVTVQDIFDFLAGYFSTSPTADVNASGTVTVQDIFDYLAVYFGGCT